jgi:hypothetical protein
MDRPVAQPANCHEIVEFVRSTLAGELDVMGV